MEHDDLRRSARGNRIELTQHLQFPHSLGLLYSAFTYYCGFKVNSGEYKLMGLAPYGRPVYRDLILEHLIDLKPDGSFRLNMDYFNYCQGLTMTGRRFHGLFGGPPRRPESDLDQRHMDLAASIQAVTEEIMLRIGRDLHAANRDEEPRPGRRRGPELRRQRPAAARRAVRRHLDPTGRRRRRRRARARPCSSGTSCWTSRRASARRRRAAREPARAAFQRTDEDSRSSSTAGRARHTSAVRRSRTELLRATSPSCWPTGKVVGWFQGRMEFGPRALGRAQHPRRPALAADAGDDEPEDQVPRELPPVRPGRAARTRRRLVRLAARAGKPVHAARRSGPASEHRAPIPAERAAR